MTRIVGALVLAALLAACTSHSEETWIGPDIGRLPDAAADAPQGDPAGE